MNLPVQPDKSEWKLNGQTLTYTLPLAESISNLKAKIQDETNMPPAKQKLFYDVSFKYFFAKLTLLKFLILQGMFFKDSNTLAYYNIIPGAVIQLQIKERGGRKK